MKKNLPFLVGITFLVVIGFSAIATVSGTISVEGGKCDEPKNVTTTFADGSSRTEIVNDSCDTDKHLKCVSGRCLCNHPDLKYQTFQVKESSVNSRSKRSPKKGKGISKGKAVAGGVAGGVIAGVAGYQLGKAVANSDSSSSGSSSSHNNHKSKEKYVTVSSCFARVGGDCALDRNKIVTVINTTVVNNVTTNVQTIKNYKDVPSCVLYAECKTRTGISSSSDSNIGVCTCKSGYEKADNDLCVKKGGSGSGINQPGYFLILISFISMSFLTIPN